MSHIRSKGNHQNTWTPKSISCSPQSIAIPYFWVQNAHVPGCHHLPTVSMYCIFTYNLVDFYGPASMRSSPHWVTGHHISPHRFDERWAAQAQSARRMQIKEIGKQTAWGVQY